MRQQSMWPGAVVAIPLIIAAFAWTMPTAATEQPRSRARVLSVKHEPTRVLNSGQVVERSWYDGWLDLACSFSGNVWSWCPVPVKDPPVGPMTPPVDTPQS